MTKRRMGTKAYIQLYMRLKLLKTSTKWLLGKIFRDVSLMWRSHHCLWSTVNFDLCSAFMAIEQWGFLYATHLLWHGSTLYNCHLRGPVTHTPVASVWQWSCPFFYDSGLSRPGIKPWSPACETHYPPLRHRRGE